MATQRVKLSAAAILICVAGAVAFVVLGGSAAAASSSKPFTCPDGNAGNSAGGGWTAVCTGQTKLGATITMTRASGALDVTVAVPKAQAFSSADTSFNLKTAAATLAFGNSTGLSSITMTITPPGGSPPGGVSLVKAPATTSSVKFYRLVFRP